MGTQKILVADDESRLRKLIGDYLVRSGYEMVEAADGITAIEILKRTDDIALVVLDVMMPHMDGFSALRHIREFSRVPIIMLTAKAQEADELEGFSLGADEYVTKPFSPKVLLARIDAVLRRSGSTSEETAKILVCNPICIDLNAHVVTVDGKSIDLSVKEFELLTYFAENPNVALSREMILNHVWDYDYYGDARTIDTHVKKLRSKLGDKAGDMIKTIWGMGYKLETNEKK